MVRRRTRDAEEQVPGWVLRFTPDDWPGETEQDRWRAWRDAVRQECAPLRSAGTYATFSLWLDVFQGVYAERAARLVEREAELTTASDPGASRPLFHARKRAQVFSSYEGYGGAPVQHVTNVTVNTNNPVAEPTSETVRRTAQYIAAARGGL